jgi:hypothetical protein
VEPASSWVDRPGRPKQEAGESREDWGQWPQSKVHASQTPTTSPMKVVKTKQADH